MYIEEATSVDGFQKLVAANDKVLVFFWAHWSQPCKSLDEIIPDILDIHPELKCIKVEAEKVPDISAHLSISAVPTFVFLAKGDVVDKLEGFDPAELSSKASSLAGSVQDPVERLKKLVREQPVMVFMKGTPDMPRCGFSRKVVEALKHINVPFGSFDILTDDEVRQGMKKFSDWPTYPQVYVGGELLGGCDIVLEMAKSDELKGAITDAVQEGGMELIEPEAELHTKIKCLLKHKPVMLFMKGTPEAPRCGFSSRVVKCLQDIDVDFGHFDILSDEEVRQGLKKYSDWPTFPQLFANSELIGGCDIIEELAAAGELKESIDEELRK